MTTKQNKVASTTAARENLDAFISVKVEASLKAALEHAANDILPDVPGNVSVLIRRVLKAFIAEHRK